MTCSLCKEKEITSPKLTGELCTSCYFQLKKTSGWNKAVEIMATPEPLLENQDEPIQQISNPIDSETTGINQYTSGDDRTSDDNDSESEGSTSNITPEDKPPIISKSNQSGESGVKYCQSCLERGFGLVPATREWRADYFICDDCFEPLLNNIISPNDEQLRVIKSSPEIDVNKPLLNQFYDLLQIPELLRYSRADAVLNSRNDIFNYHAPAILNKDVKEVASEIEQLQIMLFQIKIAIEPRQDYINRVKHSEREKANLTSIEKGKKDFSKSGPSKVKTGQDQKMADTLFKATESNPEKRLKLYLDLQKQAREEEFKKRTGT